MVRHRDSSPAATKRRPQTSQDGLKNTISRNPRLNYAASGTKTSEGGQVYMQQTSNRPYTPLYAGNPACSKRSRTRPVFRLVSIARSIAVADPWRTMAIIALHSLSVAPMSPRVKRD